MTTLKDVAALAGVSMMTVSNVVNGRLPVAESTRNRVLQAIQELDYRPNLAARNLARGRTGILSLALPDISIPYFAELAAQFMELVAERGQRVLIEQTGWSRERELEVITTTGPILSDALIIFPAHLRSTESHPARPTVFLGGTTRTDGPPGVVVDNELAGRQVAEHLVSTGRRRIALVGPLHDATIDAENRRVTGFRTALAAAGLDLSPALVADARSYHRHDGWSSTSQLLTADPLPDAIFCLSDQLAIGALRAIREKGMRVPDDIAVVGFDDVDDARYLEPPLTTVRVDREGIARSALDQVNAALEHSDDPPRGTALVSHELIIRASSAS